MLHQGTNYLSRRDVAEVARLVRADIKAALPGVKVGVTIERFAGGSSLTLKLRGATFGIHSAAYLSRDRSAYFDYRERYTSDAKQALAALEEIGKSYQRSDCDSMTDYFAVNFFLHVGVDADIEHAEAEAAAARLLVVFTGAPEAADYDTAKTVEEFECAACPGGTPMAWRKVEITAEPYRVAYQCDRYRSFLRGCPTLDDPRTHPLGTGRHAPTNGG